MSFRWPELLWVLLLVPLVALLWVRGERRRRRRAGTFGNPALLPNVLTAHPNWRRLLPVAFYLLAATVLLAALARPEATAQVPRDRATIMLVMDASTSMLNQDVQPTRLVAARRAADAFLEQLPDRFQVGLITFAAAARVESLPTTDRAAVRDMLARTQVRGGTAVGDAILRALQASRPRDAIDDERPPTSVLLLTDGNSRTGIAPLLAAEQARLAEVPIFTVAVASQPPAELAQVAALTGGQSFTAPTSDQLTAVYRDLGSRLTYVKEKRELTSLFMGGSALRRSCSCSVPPPRSPGSTASPDRPAAVPCGRWPAVSAARPDGGSSAGPGTSTRPGHRRASVAFALVRLGARLSATTSGPPWGHTPEESASARARSSRSARCSSSSGNRCP